jgi:hypothetical protein
MDITRHNFWEQLPDILHAIAGAKFVALDAEMTGIRPKRKPESPELKSLHAIFIDLKLAAETYQMVELGITCVEPGGSHGMSTQIRIVKKPQIMATLLIKKNRLLCFQDIQHQVDSNVRL